MRPPPLYTIDIDDEITNVHRFVADAYARKFPELESLVPAKMDYVRTVRRIGNEMVRCVRAGGRAGGVCGGGGGYWGVCVCRFLDDDGTGEKKIPTNTNQTYPPLNLSNTPTTTTTGPDAGGLIGPAPDRRGDGCVGHGLLDEREAAAGAGAEGA